MQEKYPDPYGQDNNMKLQDIEERQRLLRERVILLGNSLIEERDKTFQETQEMKKILLKLQEENIRMKEFIQRISEQMSEFARREELLILQRQLDILK